MTDKEIKKLIVSARNLQIKANAKMAVVLHNLENIPNNLAQAIIYHILYGECDLNELLTDIEKALADHQT